MSAKSIWIFIYILAFANDQWATWSSWLAGI